MRSRLGNLSSSQNQSAAKGGRQKEFDHFFAFRTLAGTFWQFFDVSVTFFRHFLAKWIPWGHKHPRIQWRGAGNSHPLKNNGVKQTLKRQLSLKNLLSAKCKKPFT